MEAACLALSGSETQLRLNPRLSTEDRERVEGMLREASPPPGLVWITSSGSSGFPKLVGLSRCAIHASAQAVNRHLAADQHDTWLLSLPTFHVGGLGVLARAMLTGSRVVQLAGRWTAESYHAQAEREGVTLSAMVPTQVFDLVQLGRPAPRKLRAVIIGGDALSRQLYEQARHLGYPLLPSYGLSECCSQVATATLESLEVGVMPLPTVLDHVDCRTTAEGVLQIRGTSLLDGYVMRMGSGACYVDPKQEGWFETTDRARLVGKTIEILGRTTQVVKICGEQVDMVRLSQMFGQQCPEVDAVVQAIADGRMGHRVVVVATRASGEDVVRSAVERFNAQVMPLERIRDTILVDRIPRTELGKVAWEEVRKLAAR